jgi:ech hydrogenase subunit C
MFKKLIQKARIKSPWLLHYDCGSCNGCDIEILACLTPVYDIERFGIINVGNPMHADILLVTGTVNYRNREVLLNLYDQMSIQRDRWRGQGDSGGRLRDGVPG